MKLVIKKRTLKWAAAILVLLVIAIVGWTIMNQPAKAKLVILKTSMGDVTIELAADMPITAGNFEKLVRQGFYDGVLFHRVIDNFMIQGGDPLTKDPARQAYWGTGDPGYKIKDEFTNHNRNERGTISMANAGPNTGGSQFFINLVDNSYLDSKHPVFGKVVSGMDVIDKIAKVKTAAGNRPVEPIAIIKAEMLQ